MKSRRKVPLNARRVELSMAQLRTIFPRGLKSHPISKHGDRAVTLARTSDGTWWAEWRGGAVFWAARWYEVPKSVGRRAESIDAFVKGLV